MKKTHIFQMKTILFLNGALCRNLDSYQFPDFAWCKIYWFLTFLIETIPYTFCIVFCRNKNFHICKFGDFAYCTVWKFWYLTFTMNILMQNIEILIFDIYNKDKFSILHGAEKRNLGIHQILDFEQCKLSFIQNISLVLFG